MSAIGRKTRFSLYPLLAHRQRAIHRNRRIGDFLKELDLTESRSTGIAKVLKVMKENGSPRPEFETDDDRSYFLIRLPAHPQRAVRRYTTFFRGRPVTAAA